MGNRMISSVLGKKAILTILISLILGVFQITQATIYYSYQSGSWNEPLTWTTNASGSVLAGSAVPTNGDEVVILEGRTITLPANILTTGLKITINSGGVLNMSVYTFPLLAELKGEGTLVLSSASFPSATINTFTGPGGGTTEYACSSNMNITHTVYNNLTINMNGLVATQMSNITLNGSLFVKNGTFRINDNTSTTAFTLTIQGNVTVNSGASFTVGQGKTNSTDSPLGINGGTAPFLNYYTQFHTISIGGDFTNNGTVKFTNLDHPVYNAFPSALGKTGAASVFFRGAADNTLTCNGTTDFYNLIVDKGTDQNFSLSVVSSNYHNFRLFGANIAGGTGGGADPGLRKALWIRNGTLRLRGQVIIPSLSEGGNDAGSDPAPDFVIPAKGALVIEGSQVVVLATADDYREVNTAYGVAAVSNDAMGITKGGNSAMMIYGKLHVMNGFLSTRESGGIITSTVQGGQIIIDGGVVDAKQLRGVGSAAYTQDGGTLVLRGRFQRVTTFASITNLTDISESTLSAGRDNETSLSAALGTFGLSSASNIFSMSAGTIRVYDVCGTAVPSFGYQVAASVANLNVTGGNIELYLRNGTGTANADMYISSTAPVANLSMNRISGATNFHMNSNALTILSNLAVQSGNLVANNLNMTVGGDFTLANGTSYTPGTNTTTFNGTGNSSFILNGGITGGFRDLVIDKGTGSVTLSGSAASSYSISNTFQLLSGTFNDGGKSFNVAGNITNSGIYTGTGIFTLNGTAAQTIGGDGSGVFQNLTLNNSLGTSSTAAISLTADLTVNGILNFARDGLLYIDRFGLSLGSGATITNAGSSRYIITNGGVGDKGITKTFSSTTFSFPIGVLQNLTTSPVSPTRYTPTTISFSTAPSVYGSVTVFPVDAEQMQTSSNGRNRSLTYFWRVRSSGFVLGSATVSQTFTYHTNDVVDDANVKETNYVPAVFRVLDFSWGVGLKTDINRTTKLISWPNAVNYIDGDYTAGDNSNQNPFAPLVVYFSSGENTSWGQKAAWYTDTINNVNNGSFPNGNSPAIIRNGHTIFIDGNDRTSGNLRVYKTGILDCRNFTGLSFGIVTNPVNGSGKIRISRGGFPAGDFSQFLGPDGGTIEFYTHSTPANYIIPSTTGSNDPITSYRNLEINPTAGSNITLPDRNMMIYGDFSVQGTGATGMVYLNTAAARTLTINGNLNIASGNLQFVNGAAQSLIVNGNVTIANGALFNMSGGTTTNTMTIYGNLINNGTFNVRNGSVCNITFAGNTDAVISGTGSSTVFNRITVNKGVSQATTLTLDVGGILSTPADNWLTFQNGTFRFMRTNPGTNFTVSQGTPVTIPSTAGLLVNYPNSSNVNVLIADESVDNNDLFLNGKLTLISGNIHIGPVSSPTNNNDIEYSGSGFSEIDIQGGNLTVNGQIRRNPTTAAGVLKYNQSGGNVVINGQNALNTRAKFEVLNPGSVFNMSGASNLTIIRGGGGTVYGDLYLRPELSSVTGGTINLTQGALASAQIYRIEANVPLNNLTITGNTTSANASVMVNPLVLKGNLTLSNIQSFLTTNNIHVTIRGNLVNNAAAANYVCGTNVTTFSGNIQTIGGTSATDFYDLVIAPTNSLTINSDITVFRDLTVSQGTFVTGTRYVNIKRHMVNNGTHSSDAATGGFRLNGTTEVQFLSGSGVYNRIEIDNAVFGARLFNSITLYKNIALRNGIFNINQNMLTLEQGVLIEGEPFGPNKMITPDGVYSNIGIKKHIAAGSGSFTFPVGVAGKYTPAVLNYTANATSGYLRVNIINDRHPSVFEPNNVLQYYWETESSGISGFAGSMVLHYSQADVKGDEALYAAARLIVPGTSWSKAEDNVDQNNNTITYNYTAGTSNLSGEYTAGLNSAIPDNVPTYTTNMAGNWTEKTIWTPSAGAPPCPDGGPNGFIVVINHEVTANANFCSAYRTTINASGKLSIISTYTGHNLGAVDGAGTLKIETGNLPAGRFINFLSCNSGSTLEYGGTGNYLISADRVSEVSNLIFSGSGTRTLPNSDLTVCNLMKIDGVTVDHSGSSRTLYLRGALERVNGGAYISGSNSKISFCGSAPQSMHDFSGSNAINVLEINNAAGLVLNGPVDVKGSLLLTNGRITTTQLNLLRITNSSAATVTPYGGSVNSYVNGPMAKLINQGEEFIFPVGSGTHLGNRLRVFESQTGNKYWTVEFVYPMNTTSVVAPLTQVSNYGYWSVAAENSSTGRISISWNPQSDLSPLMTQGISFMRVAKYNGTAWAEVATTQSGNAYNGTAFTTSSESISGPALYILGCTGSVIPRASIDNSAPVCQGSIIRILTTNGFMPAKISYSVNGGAPSTVTGTDQITATLAGSYVLTAYEYPLGIAGAIDATPFVVDAQPTTANAGLDKTGLEMCGLVGTILNGNTPDTGNGLWTIVGGSGGTIAAPSNPTSTFTGVSGNTYQLRWTTTNGTCTSSDDVFIAFYANPTALINTASASVCKDTAVVFTATAGLAKYQFRVNAIYEAERVINTFTTNSLNSNDEVSVLVTNSGGCSAHSNTISMSVFQSPTLVLGSIPSICQKVTSTSLPFSDLMHSPTRYMIDFSAGIPDVSFTNLPASPITIQVPENIAAGTYSGTLKIRNNVCGSVPYNINVIITPLPASGPLYRKPNN